MMNQTTFPVSQSPTSVGRSFKKQATHGQAWHALESSSVCRLLEVDPTQGLASADVANRQLRYGKNSSESLGGRTIGMLVMLFLSVAIGFFLTAAILNRAVGDSAEAFSILVVVVVVAIVGFAYLLRSARARDVMQDATRGSARVKRDGQESRVNAEDVVPGDIIIFGAGDSVPADARLLNAMQLQAQESALTRKREATEKQVSSVTTDASLTERKSMVYLGTMISAGTGVAVVVAIGVQTELGKIAGGDI
ncbi:MAG TPA: cation-transporting P-type ATPase [Pyrinomonadaceae bacterium]